MWEQSKENVQPVAKGRSARRLGEASDVALKVRTSEDKNDTFEASLCSSKQAAESEPTVETQTVVLTTYLSYAKWARESSPSSHEPCKKILERATEDMKGYTTLKNDPRFIKLWIEYVSSFMRNRLLLFTNPLAQECITNHLHLSSFVGTHLSFLLDNRRIC